jgi:16S rRNA (guanine527-N7)-methyltransferase
LTVEDEPPYAAALFGDRIEVARAFTADLAEHGEPLGLIGPLEVERLWSRHVVNCALVAPLLRPGRVGDVGSGAGLPGLVLAIARPDVELVLIEPMERRTDWLSAEAERLGLDNVTVVRGRAEDVHPDPLLDQVTARAVSALSRLVPLCAPLVKPGGELLFMKGARVDDEIAAAEKAFRKARVRDPEVLVLGEGIVPEVTRVFRARVDH